MANIVKVGRIDVNLDALSGVSRNDIYKMYSSKDDAWVDALWSHVEMLTPSKEEDQPKKKKKKTNKGGDE